jgi:hypothetical protein
MKKYLAPTILAVAFAITIAWIDTRPQWDDTGVTIGLLFISTAVCGAWLPSRAWLWALVIGGGVFGANVVLHGNYDSVVAIVAALIGAYAGAGTRKIIGSIG